MRNQALRHLRKIGRYRLLFLNPYSDRKEIHCKTVTPISNIQIQSRRIPWLMVLKVAEWSRRARMDSTTPPTPILSFPEINKCYRCHVSTIKLTEKGLDNTLHPGLPMLHPSLSQQSSPKHCHLLRSLNQPWREKSPDKWQGVSYFLSINWLKLFPINKTSHFHSTCPAKSTSAKPSTFWQGLYRGSHDHSLPRRGLVT